MKYRVSQFSFVRRRRRSSSFLKNNNSSSKSGRVACDENQTVVYFCVNDFTFQFFSVTNVTLDCCEILFVNLGQLECKLAGWGVTDLEDPKSSQHLMEVTLPWLQRNCFFVTFLSLLSHDKTNVGHFCNTFVTISSQKRSLETNVIDCSTGTHQQAGFKSPMIIFALDKQLEELMLVR